MVFVNPAPAAMVSGAFYDAAGRDYYLTPAKLESDYADVRFARELRLFRELCPGGRVLDVGCSSGAFLFQVQKRWPNDYQILGTDVSGPALDYAESRGVPVQRGDFLSADFQGRRFDVITFWATLEHLAAPRHFLDRAHALLKPDGICVALVPNLQSLATRLLGVKYRYVYPQHLNYFSALTLAQLGRAVGLDAVTTRFTHFNPVIIWQDWRQGEREVSNAERGELLKRTTALKQSPWLQPVKWGYALAEKTLAACGLADNVVVVFRRPK